MHPGDLGSRASLVMLQRQEGRLDDAIGTLKEMIEIDPQNPAHYVSLGVIYGAKREFEPAEQAFQKVCDVAPKESLGYALSAKLYLDANQKTPAAPGTGAKGRETGPHRPSLRALGRGLLEEQRPGRRRAALQEAIRRDPENPGYKKLSETIAGKKRPLSQSAGQGQERKTDGRENGKK